MRRQAQTWTTFTIPCLSSWDDAMVTFHFVPYHEIEDLNSTRRINKLMGIIKQDKIVVLEGQLQKEEEAVLIESTMNDINDEFKGIELAVIYPEKQKMDTMKRLRFDIARLLVGNRQGFTIVGPASIVKKVRQNPSSIELFTQEARKRRKR